MAEDRRTVLKVLTGVVSAGAAVTVGVPSLGALLYPAGRATVSGIGDFVPVASEDALPADGTPLKVPVVIPEPRDAWSKMPPTQVGAVYLRRTAEGIVALSTVCPHLGCGIDHVAGKEAFACPCHESAFDLEGKVSGGPSPRTMDRLETRVVSGKIEVRYLQFKQGTKDKVPA